MKIFQASLFLVPLLLVIMITKLTAQAVPSDTLAMGARTFMAPAWLLAIVSSAMGLVKIALWLRNYKAEDSSEEIKYLLQSLRDEQTRVATNLALYDKNLREFMENQSNLIISSIKEKQYELKEFIREKEDNNGSRA